MVCRRQIVGCLALALMLLGCATNQVNRQNQQAFFELQHPHLQDGTGLQGKVERRSSMGVK